MQDGTTHWALPVHTTSTDPDHISRSQQCQTNLTKYIFVRFSWNFVGLFITIYIDCFINLQYLFLNHMYSREIIDLFRWENTHTHTHTQKKTPNVGLFLDAINVRSFQLCMIVPVIELYLFISLSVTLATFQFHSSVKQF